MAGSRIRRRPRAWTLVFPAALFIGALAFAGKSDRAQVRQFGPARLLAQLSDTRIKESSGVAPSRVKDNLFYTFNDSGDSARFFRFDTTGKVLNVFNVSNASNVDWEDMASAIVDNKPYLYFGDIGDNARARKSIFVYRVAEPTGKNAKVDQKLELKYPDGSHNAEALLVNPISGDISIVTKTSQIAGVYTLKRPNTSGIYTMTKLGDVDLGGVVGDARLLTGGAWSSDGKYVVLRTYLAAYEYNAQDPSKWFATTPIQISTNLEMQGEAITYTRGGEALITTSEGAPCPVSIIPISSN